MATCSLAGGGAGVRPKSQELAATGTTHPTADDARARQEWVQFAGPLLDAALLAARAAVGEADVKEVAAFAVGGLAGRTEESGHRWFTFDDSYRAWAGLRRPDRSDPEDRRDTDSERVTDDLFNGLVVDAVERGAGSDRIAAAFDQATQAAANVLAEQLQVDAPRMLREDGFQPILGAYGLVG